MGGPRTLVVERGTKSNLSFPETIRYITKCNQDLGRLEYLERPKHLKMDMTEGH